MPTISPLGTDCSSGSSRARFAPGPCTSVVEGLVRFSVDHEESISGPGTFVFIPANTVHSFGSGGDAAARCLEINVPGGFDRYYAELARTFAPGVALDPEVLREVQRLNGIVPV